MAVLQGSTVKNHYGREGGMVLIQSRYVMESLGKTVGEIHGYSEPDFGDVRCNSFGMV